MEVIEITAETCIKTITFHKKCIGINKQTRGASKGYFCSKVLVEDDRFLGQDWASSRRDRVDTFLRWQNEINPENVEPGKFFIGLPMIDSLSQTF